MAIDASKGRLALRRADPTLEELVAGITPENRHGGTNWGPDVGKEIVER
jgi:antitoxin component of MazEF toxin-antitoxin module